MDRCIPDEIAAIRGELRLGITPAAVLAARVEALLGRFPDSPDLQVLRGQAALAAGDRALARRSFEQALALDPAHRGASEGLAACEP